MANNIPVPTVPGDTDPALTAAKIPVVTADGEREEAEPVVETHPDVWDEQGRLISHSAFTDVK